MRKELLNLDWLTVNYLIEDNPLQGNEIKIGFLKFIPETYSTRQFRFVYNVYSDYVVDKVATIVCTPISAILDKRLLQIKLDNWLLYTDLAQKTLSDIKLALQLKFLSISRVDICVDIVGFNFYEFINLYHNNKLREKKPKEVTEHYKKYDNESIYTGISWGSKLSDWTAKIYDKIREINEVSGKLYILDYFKANGIDIDNEKVWRYEFSITAPAKKYKIEDAYTIDDILLDDTNVFDFVVQKNVINYYLNLHAFSYNTGKVRFIDEKRYNIVNLLSQEVPPKKITQKR